VGARRRVGPAFFWEKGSGNDLKRWFGKRVGVDLEKKIQREDRGEEETHYEGGLRDGCKGARGLTQKSW